MSIYCPFGRRRPNIAESKIPEVGFTHFRTQEILHTLRNSLAADSAVIPMASAQAFATPRKHSSCEALATPPIPECASLLARLRPPQNHQIRLPAQAK